jgi:predicted Zn-dependent protease with MMP-like domain
MNSPFSTDSRWSHMRAPSANDLAHLARRTWDNVPASLRQMTGEIAIAVEEFPDEETMDEVGCETPFDIMGLLRDTEEGHPVLLLYRRAVLDYWVEQGEELSAVLTQVMVHETAHQLQLTEEAVALLEAEIEAAQPQPRTVQ